MNDQKESQMRSNFAEALKPFFEDTDPISAGMDRITSVIYKVLSELHLDAGLPYYGVRDEYGMNKLLERVKSFFASEKRKIAELAMETLEEILQDKEEGLLSALLAEMEEKRYLCDDEKEAVFADYIEKSSARIDDMRALMSTVAEVYGYSGLPLCDTILKNHFACRNNNPVPVQL